jgi:DNA-directed RNA polymerase subunit RPC12/RpoP
MNNNYTILAVFEYSTEAQIYKSKLESENIKTMLADEKTIDSDPLISLAIGGVKLLVHNNDLEQAIEVYDNIRLYRKDKNGNDMHCPNCHSNRILMAPPNRKNIFYMLFPFFEKSKNICNNCKTEFK